jgi:aspartyl-tRNA(Asn)/glutamyl-tRNA(Gln) amidotransferase subunit A
MSQDVLSLSLVEAARAVHDREVTPTELVEACLSRINSVDPQLNSFITVTAEQALVDACAIEHRLARGDDPGLLAGVPLAIKDLFDIQHVRTTAGSSFWKDHLANEDAACVEQLKSAGAILLGKLNMHEIALGVTNVNPHYGACHNPWNVERISGGSSGGSAVAVASEMCFGSLGSDTGGSIRIPSSLCGTVGLKPTYGRVSLRGVVPLSWNLDHAGPITRNVEDAAYLLQVIAGHDPLDPASHPAMTVDTMEYLEDPIKGWKAALADGDYFTDIEPDILLAVNAAADVFTDLGVQVKRVSFPEARQAARANGLMTTSDAAAFHKARMDEHPERFGEDVLRRLRAGAALTSSEYSLVRREQSILRLHFERFFADWDLLITPTTPVAAPSIEGPDAVEQAPLLTRFTAPFNLTGLPAISIPCGFTSQGLPIGLQLVTKPWNEARLLQAAYAYQRTTGWNCQKPYIIRRQ